MKQSIINFANAVGNWFRDFMEPSGANRSMNFNATYGKWRVKYKDGALSQPMCKDVATDYAGAFGGSVEKIPTPVAA